MHFHTWDNLFGVHQMFVYVTDENKYDHKRCVRRGFAYKHIHQSVSLS